VYEQTVKKVVNQALEGISGTVFVYGQTGTGKTYTMMGSQRALKRDQSGMLRDHSNLHETFENSGVLVFSMQDLFERIH
jgi:Cdc6-like AAA superfamily ATPase